MHNIIRIMHQALLDFNISGINYEWFQFRWLKIKGNYAAFLDNAIFQPSKIKSVHGKNDKIYRENIRNFPKFLGVSNLANDICVFCSGIVIFYYKNYL